MAELLLICWHDIPAQVIAREGRRQAKRELAPRFADAIDRAAMRAGARDDDAYLAGWVRRSLGSVQGDLDTVVEQAAARIEAEYDTARLKALVESNGQAP